MSGLGWFAALFCLFLVATVLSQGRLACWLMSLLPQWALLQVGAAIGWLASALGIRRRIAAENLRVAFPEKDDAWRRETLRGFYGHLGLLIAEFVRAPYMKPERLDRLIDVEGFEKFAPEFAKGQGAIIATAHFGNFELLGSFFARRGMPITAITKVLSRNFANAFWVDQRQRSGLKELPDSGSIRDILKVIRRGEILAIMIDQNMIPRRAIFAPFFGKLAATTPAPAVFAERTGAPVFLTVMHRLPGGRHRVVVEGPIPFDRTGDRDADVLAFTAKLNQALERHVSEAPRSWYWVHRRWKTRPESEEEAMYALHPPGAASG